MNQFMKVCMTGIAFLFPILISAQNNAPLLKFGVFTDVQYADCPPSIGRYYREALTKMDTCLQIFNEQNVEFVINLGDIIDRDIRDMNKVLQHIKVLKSSVYHLTGNHDYKYKDGTADSVLYQQLQMPSPYYTFQKEGWQFIMLNTNEISTYANKGDKRKEEELKDILDRIKETGGKQAYNWNGGISRKQMQWLENVLAICEREKLPVIVCSHHPFYPFSEYTALNNEQILNILTQYSCVKLVLSGHHHAGAFGYYKGLPLVTVEGIVETEKQNACLTVEIKQDSILLQGYGRAISRSFTIRE